MPMRSTPIRDRNGNVIGRACYREPRRSCQTTGCPRAGMLLCDYPVTRRGRATTCNRALCGSCAKAVGRGGRGSVHYCPPHAKLHAQEESKRCAKEADDARFRELMADFKPVKPDE